MPTAAPRRLSANVPDGVLTRTLLHDAGSAAPGITSAPSIITIETSPSAASASPSGRASSTVSSRPITHASLLRRHPERAVQADDLAVQVAVGDDMLDELGVVVGRAE